MFQIRVVEGNLADSVKSCCLKQAWGDWASLRAAVSHTRGEGSIFSDPCLITAEVRLGDIAGSLGFRA